MRQVVIMNDLELIFTMLGEAATTEITRNRDARGFEAASGVELSTFCRQLKRTSTGANEQLDAARAIRSYLTWRRTITV